MEIGTGYRLKERLIATSQVKNMREPENFTLFEDAVKKMKNKRSTLEEKQMNLEKAERRTVYSMRAKTSMFARICYEQKAKEAKKVLDEIIRNKDNYSKTNRSRIEPTGLTAPKHVARKAPERNEKDCLTKVIRKRTVSQKQIGPTAVPATNLEKNGMDYTSAKEMDKHNEDRQTP